MIAKCPACNNQVKEYEKDRWMCVNYKDPFDRNIGYGELGEGECDFFFDKDGYDYMLDDLVNKSPRGFFSMANVDQAEVYNKLLKEEYPSILYIKHENFQYFAINKSGKEYLLQLFVEHKSKIDKDLIDTSETLDVIKSSLL